MRVETKELGTVNVRFTHVRNEHNNYISPVSQKPKAPRGEETFTECMITLDEGTLQEDGIFGRSYLNPGDNYNKEFGRRLSLQRAIDELDCKKTTERQIWAGYFLRDETNGNNESES